MSKSAVVYLISSVQSLSRVRLFVSNGVLVIKTNELSSHEIIQRKLKYRILNERSQSEKATYCMTPIVWYSEEGKTIETVKRSVVSRG